MTRYAPSGGVTRCSVAGRACAIHPFCRRRRLQITQPGHPCRRGEGEGLIRDYPGRPRFIKCPLAERLSSCLRVTQELALYLTYETAWRASLKSAPLVPVERIAERYPPAGTSQCNIEEPAFLLELTRIEKIHC